MKTIREIIRQEIPVEFFIEWNNSLQEAYNLAVILVAKSDLEYPQAKNLLSYSYNNYIDQILKHIARRYSCFDVRDAQAENGHYFTILRTGSIILTQKAISSSGSMIKPSKIRYSLARGNSYYCGGQCLTLFPADAMEIDPSRDKVYGILTHNRVSVFVKEEKVFSHLAFPDPNFDDYIENINLIDYCNAGNTIKPVELPVAEIQDEVKPVLKIDITKEEVK